MTIDLRRMPDKPAYDVIVVGAGGAGMAAALFAAIEGQSVLLIERTGHVGGTTAFSAATTWIPNSHHRAATGAPDSPETAARYLDLAVGDRSSAALRRAFLEAGPKAVETIEANSEVKFRARPFHPDYISELEGSTLCGRALEPLPFDGRKLGRHFALIRPPIPEFTVLGGMMIDRDDIGHLLKLTKSWPSFKHALTLVLRHAMDRARHPRGTRLVMGNALIGRLLHSLLQRGVDILVDTTVGELVRDGGAITGVVASQAGDSRRIAARRGVVLASGGFSRHGTLRAAMLHQPTPEHSPIAPGNTGAMHDLALAAGARYGTGNLDNAFWAPVSVRRRPDRSTAVFPHFILDRCKPGMVTVNKAGKRFVDESTSYHLFGRAMFESNRTVPTIPAFLITDSEGLRKYGLGMVHPGGKKLEPFLRDGYLTMGATLDELAGKLDIDATGLRETVARMNEYAWTGVDPEFGRGTTAYNRANGDPNQTPNPNLGPIGTAPFYAVRLYPGDIGAATGFVTDADARVLGPDDRPIQGLYACGNDMNSIMGGVYPAPGITIGPGLAFAYLAARHAAHADRPRTVKEMETCAPL
ncbi:succinate dehydrogenase/fumarate reductase flavoprotein subunit [Azospirillum agricola]|uniref:FAD-dependent oxidoreductase n=1 Tax=Azospirillum agricola TaxID=1720247 RepID=UPI001F46395B|nr:FAD-dependent oxidoreductase [Azospirillum agricola]MBP2228754.1 succinate dehydrogenase/fumarate reductase flavoprotein subunit [Azospirillum agricola]